MDAGEQWVLNDAAGKPIRAWNSRGYSFAPNTMSCHRQTQSFVKGGDPSEIDAQLFPNEILVERAVYGDSPSSGLSELQRIQGNLRGRVFRQYDTAGLVTTDFMTFKGNSLHTARQFTSDYKNVPDWSRNLALELETFASVTVFDALNRAVALRSRTGVFTARHSAQRIFWKR